MTIDRVEATRRGQSAQRKASSHPYAAIEHRVIDSPAFADLKSSAKVLLLLLARQYNGRNNGHLQATFAWCKGFGIGSEHTLQASVADLIEHGFIYRTKSHGANKVWAKYALTWLPIPDKEGLFLGGWKQMAWRDWQPAEKKAPRKMCRTLPAESAVSTPEFLQKVQEGGGQKLQTMNLLPCSDADGALSNNAALVDHPLDFSAHEPGGWIHEYMARLSARGLAHECRVAWIQTH